MPLRKVAVFALAVAFIPQSAVAQDHFPPKFLETVECFKAKGLIQGTVTDVMRGDAHFAPYFKETKIGGRQPSMRFNSDFVEGRLKVSPEILKVCNPNMRLHKNSPQGN